MIFSNDDTLIQSTQLSNFADQRGKLHRSVSSQLFRVNTLDEAHDLIAANVCPHKISILDNLDQLDVDFRGMRHRDLSILNINYGAHVHVAPTENNEFYFAQTILSGSSCLYHNDEMVPSQAGQTIVVSPQNCYKMDIPAGSKRLVIGIQHEVMKQYLESIIQENISDKLVFDMKISEQKNQQIWVNHVLNLSRMLASQESIFVNSRMFESQFEATMCLMLSLFHHNYSDILRSSKDTATPRRIARAKDYIIENIKQAITVNDVANAACISPRALQYSFREHVGMSPSKYMRKIKLEAVRQALQKADSRSNVTNILSDFGITSYGHFSKFYRETFGCTPKVTLQRHR
ncbi:MAG: hypothetical protein COA43_01620 [Robiginitomaculum sp.]|nr:MAG: hypothetical protein COA43_01620 [Robiginitomaculum sp.]